jgi:hypothetical protein
VKPLRRSNLGSECVGRGPNPQTFGSIAIRVDDTDTSEIVDRFGIPGLAVERAAEIHLEQPAAVVDLGIAHYGEPPSVVAYAGKKEVGKADVDPRPRQIENVRLVADGIDRITVSSSGGGAVINYVRATLPRPKTRTPSRRTSRSK